MSGDPRPQDSQDEREAVILLQVDNVVVNEVKGARRTKLDQGEMTVLKIFATDEELKELGCAVATEATQETSEVHFVIIGEHKLPIIKSVPILRKEEWKYTFMMPGLFIEVVMPDDVDPEEIEVLELIFTQNGVLRIKGQPVVASTMTLSREGVQVEARGTVGERIGGGITTVSTKIVTGITTTTPKVQSGIAKGSEKARSRITPNEVPMEVKNKDAVRQARLATKTAVIVSGQMAAAMVGLAKQLGSQLGGSISNSPTGSRMAENEKLGEAKKVAVAGLSSTVAVVEAATDALKQILTSSCEGVSEVVGHKYGPDAGAACKDGLGCVTDVVEAGMNLRAVGVKGLAKAAGKEAAKEVVTR